MCRRIPVLSAEDVRKLQNGEFLHGLVEQSAPGTGKSGSSAADTMNSVLDDLEALFGFGSAPAGDAGQGRDEVTEEDLRIDQIIYCHQEKFYLRGKRQDYAVQFCPFCGNKF